MRLSLLALIGIVGLAGMAWHSRAFEEEKYGAEVGYYEGTTERWHIGQPTSRKDCTAEATGMYNRFNYEKSGRAFSWACLLTRVGRYLLRHR